jgi:alkaline phosphatase D
MSRRDLSSPAAPLRVPARRLALYTACDAVVAAVAAPALAGTAAAPAVQVLHGFADQQSITLWLQGAAAQSVRVQLRPAGGTRATPRTLPAELDAQADCSTMLRISDLEPGTAYRYAVLPARGTQVLAEGRFRTQPLWQWRTDPPTVRIVAGSCAYLNDGRFDRPGPPYGGGEEVFDTIAAAQPDLMLWLGDNIYLREPEWTSREGMNRRYRFYRSHPALRRLWTAAPHLALWDDHDFGPNDADSSFVNRAWALEMFRRYWPVPYAAPADGLYGQVTQGDVDIFMLDDRSYRYPNRWPDSADKAQFGRAQMHWLKGALVSSRAPFKLVAAGGQFWNRASRYEAWSRFPAEQQELRQWLAEQKIPGVVFLSGDRHFAQLLRIERPGLYPLHELTTSPLTSSPVREPGDDERNNSDMVPGTLFNERNFALLTVSGPRTERVLTIELMDTQGRRRWGWSARASDLAEGTRGGG